MASSKGEIPFVTEGDFGAFKAYVRDGKIVIRKRYNLVGKRTPTPDEMAQRTLWGNVVSGYRAMDQGDDLHPSFENKKRGVTDYNMFTSINRQRARVYLTKEEVEQGACVLDNWVCSEGNLLPSVAVERLENNFVCDICVGSLTITEQTTVARFSRFVKRNNPGRFHNGDEIAFFFAQQKVNPGTEQPYVGVVAGKVTLDVECDLPLCLVTPMLGFLVVQRGGKGYLACEAVEDSMVCWMQTRKGRDGQVQITTQTLFGSNSMLAKYISQKALDKAVASYTKRMRREFLRPSKNTPLDDAGTDEEDTEETSPENGSGSTGSDSGSGNTGNGTGNTDPTKFTISGLVSPAGAGVVTVSPAQPVVSGTLVTLTAVANSGMRFKQWDNGSTQNPLTVTATASKSYTAVFEDIPSGGNNGGGTGSDGEGPDAEGKVQVTVTGNITNGSVEYLGSGRYTPGTEVQIQAKLLPAAGDMTFDGWNDGNMQNPRTIEVPDHNVTYRASFALEVGK